MNAKVFSLIFLAFHFMAPTANAAISPSQREVVLSYAGLRTFGEFSRTLVASKVATTDEAKSIERTLKANGLTLDSEITPGIFTDTRWEWGDVRLSRLNNGDWKTQQGRILSAKPETHFDVLFAQAMSALNPHNAQRTPLDLLIDTADAQPTPQARASAAGGWSVYQFFREISTSTRASYWNASSRGNIECTSTGGYVVGNGYKASATNWGPEELAPTPIDPKVLKGICPDVAVPKCSDNNGTAMQAVLTQLCKNAPLSGCMKADGAMIADELKKQPNWIRDAKRAAGESVFCTPTHKTAAEDGAYENNGHLDAASRFGEAQSAQAVVHHSTGTK